MQYFCLNFAVDGLKFCDIFVQIYGAK